VTTPFEPLPADANHVCDLCFMQFSPADIGPHMKDVHNIDQPATVGQVIQRDGKLIIRDHTSEMIVNLEAWFTWMMLGEPKNVWNGIESYNVTQEAVDARSSE